MNKVISILGCMAVAVLFIAATKGDQPPKARSGAIGVAAYDGGTAAIDGGVNPTKVFTGLPGRNAFAIYNNGTVTIWCGWSKSVTPANGFPVVAAGSLSIDMTYNNGGDQDFYCVQSNGTDQVTPADTRWIQVK